MLPHSNIERAAFEFYGIDYNGGTLWPKPAEVANWIQGHYAYRDAESAEARYRLQLTMIGAQKDLTDKILLDILYVRDPSPTVENLTDWFQKGTELVRSVEISMADLLGPKEWDFYVTERNMISALEEFPVDKQRMQQSLLQSHMRMAAPLEEKLQSAGVENTFRQYTHYPQASSLLLMAFMHYKDALFEQSQNRRPPSLRLVHSA